MIRHFGGNGRIRCAVGGCTALTDDVTYVGLVRLEAVTTGTMMAMNLGGVGGQEGFYDFAIEGSKLMVYRAGAGSYGLSTTGLAGRWLLLVETRPAGASKPARSHIYDFTTEEWKHQEGSGNVSNYVTPADEVRFGQWGVLEQFLGEMAAIMALDYALSDAEVEALLTIADMGDWMSLTPVGLWFFNQPNNETPVLDYTGNGADEFENEPGGLVAVAEKPPLLYPGEEAEPGPPEVTTEPATAITGASAHLNGRVKANGKPTDYWFEWGLTEGLGSSIPIGKEGPGGEGFVNSPVFQALSGLAPNTKYFYRIVAKSELGEDTGTIQNFTTASGISVKVKVGGKLVDANRYVRAGGVLVPA